MTSLVHCGRQWRLKTFLSFPLFKQRFNAFDNHKNNTLSCVVVSAGTSKFQLFSSLVESVNENDDVSRNEGKANGHGDKKECNEQAGVFKDNHQELQKRLHKEFPMKGKKEKQKIKISERPIKLSVYKRVLPSNLVALNSEEGRRRFRSALIEDLTLESYFPLSEQFLTQSDPAFCGVSTLAMVLNALSIDPSNVRWKGIWRWVDENVLLGPAAQCCISKEYVKEHGITVDQFQRMGSCFGANIELYRPGNEDSSGRNCVDDFREDVIKWSKETQKMVVASFSRADLKQTGEDGHFSPIAGYHGESDSVLVMDVARFKYSPYWVSVDELYNAMTTEDPITGLSRGWFVVAPTYKQQLEVASGRKRHANLVPASHELDVEVCPIGKIKKSFCPVAPFP